MCRRLLHALAQLQQAGAHGGRFGQVGLQAHEIAGLGLREEGFQHAGGAFAVGGGVVVHAVFAGGGLVALGQLAGGFHGLHQLVGGRFGGLHVGLVEGVNLNTALATAVATSQR